MKQFHYLSLAALSLAVLIPQACGLIDVETVDNIDTTSTLGKGTEVTVFAEKKFTLKDFVTAETSPLLSVNEQGEFLISKDLGKQELGDGFKFDASSFAINVSNDANPFSQKISLSKATIPAKTPLSYNEADAAAVELYFQNFAQGVDIEFFQSLLSQQYQFSLDNIDFSIPGFPELITAFKNAELDGSFELTLIPAGIPFNKIVFNEGLQISFPSFLKFASCNNSAFRIEGGSKLVANSNVEVPMGTGLTLTLDFQSLDKGDGVATDKKLELSGSVSVNGTISIQPADFTGDTETIDLAKIDLLAGSLNGAGPHTILIVKEDTQLGDFDVTCKYATDNVTLKNATIKLSKSAIPSFDAGNTAFEVGDLGSFFGDGAEVELADVQVKLAVDSKLPFDFGLNAKLASLTGETVNHEYPLGPLDFAANKVTTYSLGTHADGTEGDVIYKKVDGIGGLLHPVPTSIETRDFQILFDENQWLTVDSGKNYGGSFEVGVEAPVSFTKDTKISFNIPVPDVDLDLSITGDIIKGETTAVIKMHVINTMPFDFSMDVVAKDGDKNTIDGLRSSMNPAAFGAASLANPWEEDVEMTIIFPANSKLIRSIGFNLVASSKGDFTLNQNQSITLKNVKFCLPNGITTDLKDLVK